jgi:HlyD family secretion protein
MDLASATAWGLLAVVAGVIYWVRFAPIPVAQHQVKRGEIVAEVMGTGTLEAHVKTTVSSKISGRVAEMRVDQGDRVQHGQLLVRLDDEELKQQVAIAQAKRVAAQAAIDRLKTDKDRAIAVFEQANRNHARVAALVAKKVASQDDLDRAVEALSVSQAGLSRAEAAITRGRRNASPPRKRWSITGRDWPTRRSRLPSMV